MTCKNLTLSLLAAGFVLLIGGLPTSEAQAKVNYSFANNEPYYQKIGNNQYLFKVYTSGILAGVMRLKVTGKILTWYASNGAETFTQTSTTPGRKLGRDNSPALNLTGNQAKAWIKRHLGVYAPNASY